MWNVIPPPEWLETEEQIINASRYLLTTVFETGLAVDTETTGRNIARDYALLVSLSDGRRRFAMYIGWACHPAIKENLLENPNIFKVLTNAKFDKHMLANRGIDLAGPLHDTLVMDWLWDENRGESGRHGLKETAKDYLGLRMKEFKEVFHMKKATKTQPAETPGEAIRRTMNDPQGRLEAIDYSGLDAYASMRVHDYLRDKLMQVEMIKGWTLWNHFLAEEVPFTTVLWNMERRGFPICTGHLRAQKIPILRTIEECNTEITQRVGESVNLNSPQQLQKLFFARFQCQSVKKTKGGKSGIIKDSTDEDVLTEFARNGSGPWPDHVKAIAKLILKNRKVSKVLGTYINGILGLVHSVNEDEPRIHTTLNQHGTVTGRLSSSEPNLQNIPRPKGDDFKIRSAFVASPGKRLVVMDYDQLEMKLMAHFSEDQKMIGAINNGLDLHCYTVSLMYGKNYDEVFAAKKAKQPTPEQEELLGLRQAAKNVGFGLIYGIGPQKLADDLTEELGREITFDEGKKLIKLYFGVFPGVEAFIKYVHLYCKQMQFVQTLKGRFRRLPNINAGSWANRKDDSDDAKKAKGVAAQAQRQAVNSIIQGTAADIAKAAMMRAEYDPELNELGAQLLMQIHDELIWEVDDNKEVVDLVKKRARIIMEDPFSGFQLRIPLTVGGSDGYSWLEAK